MPSDPMPATPRLDRRGLLRAGAAAIPLGAVAAAATALAEPVHADPSVTDGRTRLEDVALSSLAQRSSDQGAPCRVIEDAHATMIGTSWEGGALDAVRVRGVDVDGEWSPWYTLETAEDPDSGAALGAAEPAWLGAVSEIEVVALRDGADASDGMTAHVLTTSPRSEEAAGASASAMSRMSTSAVAAGDSVRLGPGAPSIVRRSAWGADESLTGSVSSASELRAVVVHHTAGSNSYSSADVPQLLRGILTYHTKTLGWADIGYNLLVDKYGKIYEGRHGGLHKSIVGAHAYGFNTYSCGVSVMGTYTSSAPSSAALKAVEAIAAWKLLGTFHVNASQEFAWTSTVSGGGILYPKGTTAHLRRVFGHRDVNATECPGNAFYPKLPSVRSATTSRMSGGWRLHYDAFAKTGTSTLGTVTQVPHVEGSFYVTRLTKGLVISSSSGKKDARATTFRTWTSSWGLPVAGSRMDGDRRIQAFTEGVAARTSGKSAERFVAQKFSDVKPTRQFFLEIHDMRAEGITTGWSDGTFRPRLEQARDAMVVYLYRAMGSPSFTPPTTSPFSDVRPSTRYYKEMTWARAKGIAEGWPDGTFRPTASVQRGAVAAFLHRAAGSPSVSGGTGFRDVPTSHQFYRPIRWMATQGITTGYTDGTFRPLAPITRDAMAAFILRWMSATGR